jgi:ketosteroid isomerase-like protein
MNAHDLDTAAALFATDYRSSQPAHPGRTFTGRAQMRANWAAMFAGVPDFRAEQLRSVDDGRLTWSEWHWSGTRSDGQRFEMRGITLFEIANEVIVAGWLYVEDVEVNLIGIDDAVERLSGQRPPAADR